MERGLVDPRRWRDCGVGDDGGGETGDDDGRVSDAGVAALCGGACAGRLRALALDGADELSWRSATALRRRCRALRALSIVGCRGISEESLLDLVVEVRENDMAQKDLVSEQLTGTATRSLRDLVVEVLVMTWHGRISSLNNNQ